MSADERDAMGAKLKWGRKLDHVHLPMTPGG